MREILFRGKLKISGEWAFSKCPTATMCCGAEKYDFIPETVGQFTGLTDKNGKKIFEGDIVKYINPEEEAIIGSVCFGGHSFLGDHDVGFYVSWRKPQWAMHMRDDIGFWTRHRELEIIGNIHDNPDLLEGGAVDG